MEGLKTAFDGPVSECMVAPVHTIGAGDPLVVAERRMAELGVSALPVVDANGGLVGVLSRTDLLRVGRMRGDEGRRARALTLPVGTVSETMQPVVEVVARDAPLCAAARRMVRAHIHRVYVVENRRLVGVVSTQEMMRALCAARVQVPIFEIAHSTLVVVESSASISIAIQALVDSHATGVVVVEQNWPIGVFAQSDALIARDAPAEERVDEWMTPHVICLPERITAHRAVAQALATGARWVLTVDADGVRGILTGMDFARLVQDSGS